MLVLTHQDIVCDQCDPEHHYYKATCAFYVFLPLDPLEVSITP